MGTFFYPARPRSCEENPELKGNIRDFATIEQLIVMVNLENMNAHLINQGLGQKQRLIELNKMARIQLQSFLGSDSVQKIKDMSDIRHRLGV